MPTDEEKSLHRPQWPSFVGGYKNDAFVSYSFNDEHKEEDTAPEGWVSTLTRALEKHVDAQLKAELDAINQAVPESLHSSVRIYSDYYMHGGEDLSHLQQEIEQSYALIVVMSRSFCGSEWCRREVEWYFNTPGRTDPKVFIVEAGPTDKSKWPAALTQRDIKTIRFYDERVTAAGLGATPGDATYAWPNAKRNPDPHFYTRLSYLKKAVAIALQKAQAATGIRRVTDAIIRTAGATAKPEFASDALLLKQPKGLREEAPDFAQINRVFVGPAAPSLDRKQSQVIKELQNRGIEVVPAGNGRPTTGEGWKTLFAQGISDCDAYIQLLDHDPVWHYYADSLSEMFPDGLGFHSARAGLEQFGEQGTYFWVIPGYNYESKFANPTSVEDEDKPYWHLLRQIWDGKIFSHTVAQFLDELPLPNPTVMVEASGPVAYDPNKLCIAMEYVSHAKSLADRASEIIESTVDDLPMASDSRFSGIEWLKPSRQRPFVVGRNEQQDNFHSIIYIYAYNKCDWYNKRISELKKYLRKKSGIPTFVSCIRFEPSEDFEERIQDRTIWTIDFTHSVIEMPHDAAANEGTGQQSTATSEEAGALEKKKLYEEASMTELRRYILAVAKKIASSTPQA